MRVTLTTLLLIACAADPSVVHHSGASPLVRTAALTAARLLRAASAPPPGTPLPLTIGIDTGGGAGCAADGPLVALSTTDDLSALAAACARLRAAVARINTGDLLDDDAHAVIAEATVSGPVFLIAARTARGVALGVSTWAHAALRAAYTLGAEHVPVASPTLSAALMRAAAAAPSMVATPRFSTRGFFPWSNFGMGSDSFDGGAWRAYMASMASLRLNTLQLHNYNADDHRVYGAQPFAWFGEERDILPNGAVARGHAAWHTSTLNAFDHSSSFEEGWARNTSSFDGGAGSIYPADCFGSPLQTGLADRCPRPATPASILEMWSDAALFYNESVWRPARALGLNMSLAVGVPLTLPAPRDASRPPRAGHFCAALPFLHTGAESPDACAALCVAMQCTCFDTGTPPPGQPPPNDAPCRITMLGNATAPSAWGYTAHALVGGTPVSQLAAYRGTLARLANAYAGGVDTFVLWAQIQSTLIDFQAVAEELAIAADALHGLGLGASLASGGWNLGPVSNLTYLDDIAAPDVILTTLLPGEGTSDEPPSGLAAVTHHAAWTIPWLEGDNGLLAPQLWVQRTLRQLDEGAAAQRVNGALAIHWRVIQCAPTATAFALGAWGAVSADAVWEEYVSAAFALPPHGAPALEPLRTGIIAALRALDGNGSWSGEPLPQVSFSVSTGDVPGSDAAIAARWAFIERNWDPLLATAAHTPSLPPRALRQLRWWVAQWSASRSKQTLMLRSLDFDGVWANVTAAPPAQRAALAASLGVPALAAMSRAYDALLCSLLSTAESFGDIGIISEVNGATSPSIEAAAKDLRSLVSVPSSALPSTTYCGAPHAWAPGIAPSAPAHGMWSVDVWGIAAGGVAGVQLCVARAPPPGQATCSDMTRVGGSVWRGSAPVGAEGTLFDAYARVALVGGGELRLPDGAPDAGVWTIVAEVE